MISVHAQKRLRERGIRQRDIRNCIMSGEIIEQYPTDFPFPSCLVFRHTTDARVLHDEGTMSRIITAYFPDYEKFEKDLKTRKGCRQ